MGLFIRDRICSQLGPLFQDGWCLRNSIIRVFYTICLPGNYFISDLLSEQKKVKVANNAFDMLCM